MQILVTFPSHELAEDFARKWALYSLRGSNMCHKRADGPPSVTLFDTTEQDVEWVRNQIEAIKKQQN